MTSGGWWRASSMTRARVQVVEVEVQV